MNRKLFTLIMTVLITSGWAFGQYNTSVNSGFSTQDVGFKLNNSTELAGFLSKLQMHHSFGVSMASSQNGSVGMMSYQNEFYLPLSERLHIKGDVFVVQPAFASNPLLQNTMGQNPSVYYDTELQYKLGENTHISLGLSNLPTFYSQNSYLNRWYGW